MHKQREPSRLFRLIYSFWALPTLMSLYLQSSDGKSTYIAEHTEWIPFGGRVTTFSPTAMSFIRRLYIRILMSCNHPHTWRVSSEFDNCSRIRPMFMGEWASLALKKKKRQFLPFHFQFRGARAFHIFHLIHPRAGWRNDSHLKIAQLWRSLFGCRYKLRRWTLSLWCVEWGKASGWETTPPSARLRCACSAEHLGPSFPFLRAPLLLYPLSFIVYSISCTCI